LTEEAGNICDEEESKEDEEHDGQDTRDIQNKSAQRFQGQVSRYDGGKNGVLRFILGDFDPASPHTTAASRAVYGFKRALVIIQCGTSTSATRRS
jgi:hypothetical protein